MRHYTVGAAFVLGVTARLAIGPYLIVWAIGRTVWLLIKGDYLQVMGSVALFLYGVAVIAFGSLLSFWARMEAHREYD